ncbi:uncharacterized protein LOC131156021 [Malania oleifera]|uniref:uncharacterized protein LOC131156021 n=1 Tax=Malania oleifera TaxID=397392 RepID=UPI0025AE5A3A|nr:uncharacterized protein LOC131156021 [Malania oleifera]
MTEIARSSREQGGLFAGHSCTIEKFNKMNPLAFSGGVDPAVAENWMQETEKDLEVLQYFPATVREVKVKRFLNLKQNLLSVQQYAARFIELSRFSPYIVPNEIKKARQIERCLRQGIFKQVVVLKIQDFAELVDRGALVEIRERMDAEEQEQKKRSVSSGFQQGFRQGLWRRGNYGRGQRQVVGDYKVQAMQNPHVCQTCGRRHWGECRLGRAVYYRCGRHGHLMCDCPTPPYVASAPRSYQGGYQAPRGG